jgi:hypothetical protein
VLAIERLARERFPNRGKNCDDSSLERRSQMEIPLLPRRSLMGVSLAAALLAGASSALVGVCGPFTDVAADAFCPFVLEVFTLGITTGTTPTTYDPAANVSRLQMAAFLSRSVDGVLKRGSRRAALRKFVLAQNASVVGLTTVGLIPLTLASDGADIWVANSSGNSVNRVRASDGRLLETWTGATAANGVLSEMGRILVAGGTNPGRLYVIDPSGPAGVVTTVASNLGDNPAGGIAFDGARVWTANLGGGNISILTPGASIPWTVTTVTSGFGAPNGALFDGTNVWITDLIGGTLKKLDPSGAVLVTVTLGTSPSHPVFDGANIWVPVLNSGTVAVVRASNGALLQTLTGNGLASPHAAAFDGERILVTNSSSVSFWKAADLTPLGSAPTAAGTVPRGAASDGVNFWVTFSNASKLARF